MAELKGFQAKYLRGLAHGLKPVVHIGQGGLTDTVVQSLDAALDRHELIKVKFIAFKEKERKREIAVEIEKGTMSALAGMIGHTAIFFRPQKDPRKRKIHLPAKPQKP